MYVEGLKHKGWHVAVKINPRDYYDMNLQYSHDENVESYLQTMVCYVSTDDGNQDINLERTDMPDIIIDTILSLDSDDQPSKSHLGEGINCSLSTKDASCGLMLVAIRKAWIDYHPNDKLHGVPLGEGNVHMTIIDILVRDAEIPLSKNEAKYVHEVIRGFVAWPRYIVKLSSLSKNSRVSGVLNQEKHLQEKDDRNKGKKNKVRKKKSLQHEVDQQSPIDLMKLPCQLRMVAFYVQEFMKDGRTVKCPISFEFNGNVMSIYLSADEIYEFVVFQEISANCIMVYLR